VEVAVLIEEEVFGAAVEADCGAESWGAFFGEGGGVVVAAFPVFTEDGFEFGFEAPGIFLALGPAVERGHDGARVAGDAGEEVWILEAELDGAVTAHGEAADGAAFARGDGGEGAIDEGEDVFDDVVFVEAEVAAGRMGGGVGVPEAAGFGHGDDQGDGRGFGAGSGAADVAFEGGAAGPGGAIAGEAVEEVEDGEGRGAVFREEENHAGGEVEGVGFEGDFEEGHGEGPLCGAGNLAGG